MKRRDGGTAVPLPSTQTCLPRGRAGGACHADHPSARAYPREHTSRAFAARPPPPGPEGHAPSRPPPPPTHARAQTRGLPRGALGDAGVAVNFCMCNSIHFDRRGPRSTRQRAARSARQLRAEGLPPSAAGPFFSGSVKSHSAGSSSSGSCGRGNTGAEGAGGGGGLMGLGGRAGLFPSVRGVGG